MALVFINTRDDQSIKENENLTRGQVVWVVDGDTAHIEIDGIKEKVRFASINTPEYNPKKGISEPYGKDALTYTMDIIKDKRVYLEKDVSDTDKYGRLLRYIWLQKPKDPANPTREELEDLLLNGKLVKEGLAYSGNYKPDVKYKKYLDDFEKEARAGQKGIWSDNYD